MYNGGKSVETCCTSEECSGVDVVDTESALVGLPGPFDLAEDGAIP